MASLFATLVLALGLMLGAVLPSQVQASEAPIAVDVPASIHLQFGPLKPNACYRAQRPADGRLTATVTGPGNWDVCIGDHECPFDCMDSGLRSASTEPHTSGPHYFVRVVSKTPSSSATLAIFPTAQPPNTANVAGTWLVNFKGRTSTTLTLQQVGSAVTGQLTTTDGSAGRVTGTVVGSTLSLSRNTGRDTTQQYEVLVKGESFSGTFKNVGKFADSGSFTGSRTSRAPSAIDVSGTWSVVFKGSTRTTMSLQQTGDIVTGQLTTTDGTPGVVTGRVAGNTLTLSRDTGLATTQHYSVTVEGSAFSGSFRNEGRIPDSGTFVGSKY